MTKVEKLLITQPYCFLIGMFGGMLGIPFLVVLMTSVIFLWIILWVVPND